MSRGSIRIGWSSADDRQRAGIGRHFGLFRMTHINDQRGRHISAGRLVLGRRDLEPLLEKGIRLKVTVIGLLRLEDDVSPVLAETVLDARVLGWLVAEPRTKAALSTE